MENNEDRPEDLLVIAFHRGVGLDDGRSDEVSVRISFHLDIASVQEDLSALWLGGADKPEDTIFGGRRNDRAPVHSSMRDGSSGGGKNVQVSVRLKASVDAEFRCALDETGKEFLGIPNEDGDGNRHATLTSSAKGCTGDRVQRVVKVG